MQCGTWCPWARPSVFSSLAVLGLRTRSTAKASAAFLGDKANHLPTHTVMGMMERDQRTHLQMVVDIRPAGERCLAPERHVKAALEIL